MKGKAKPSFVVWLSAWLFVIQSLLLLLLSLLSIQSSKALLSTPVLAASNRCVTAFPKQCDFSLTRVMALSTTTTTTDDEDQRTTKLQTRHFSTFSRSTSSLSSSVVAADTPQYNNNNNNNHDNKAMAFLRKIGRVGGNRVDFTHAIGVDEGSSTKTAGKWGTMKKCKAAFQSCTDSGTIDDMSEEFPVTSSGTQWSGITDRVMGGDVQWDSDSRNFSW
jgi:hypothetical protein